MFLTTLFSQKKNTAYRISANSFHGNYSFLNLTLCTVTFGYSTYRCGNYSREETIQGRELFAEIRYAGAQPKNKQMSLYMCMLIRKTLGITLRSDTYSRNVSAKITFF